MIWNEEYETLPREALEKLQLKRLRATVERVYASVPFYKKKFDEKGLTPSHIRTLEDIARLPFTTKTDLRDNYPFGLFSLPMEDVVRIHASSGTTGNKLFVDWARLSTTGLTSLELSANELIEAGQVELVGGKPELAPEIEVPNNP